VIPKGQEFSTEYRRTEITPLPPDKIPPEAFDGQKVLESARKENAVIHVD
jgi:hypothetical protein